MDFDEDFVGAWGGHGGFGQLEGVDALEGGFPLLDRHFRLFLLLFFSAAFSLFPLFDKL